MFARDRADLGPAHAAELAAAEAARYAAPRPAEQVMFDLHAAWTIEQNCLDRLAFWQPQRDQLREAVAVEAPHLGELDTLKAARERAATAAEQAHQRAQASATAKAADADRIRNGLLRCWDDERDAARTAARVVLDGPGRLRVRRGAVARAGEQLADWADRWRRQVPSLPSYTTEPTSVAGWFDNRPALWQAFDAAARRAAERAHPEHADLRAAADTARQQHEQAGSALSEARRQRDQRLQHLGPVAWSAEAEARLAELERDIAATRQELTDARARIDTLKAERRDIPTAEPALYAQPEDHLAHEYNDWRARRNGELAARRARVAAVTASGPTIRRPPPTPPSLGPRPGSGRGIGR